ncbi:DUF6308 family protein [Streptomyces sp. NPDC001621]|uniref:DUF6308 family protein n=1 Tax=Streptomyces sp. NPDC001621 TaxID=3364594 RepID=UPI0036B5D60C
MTDQHIHVGGRRVEIEKAAFWIKDYFDETANREAAALGKGPVYAYPAYDRLATGSGPNELNDGDLLAPLVLNAGPSIKAVYSLQRVRPALERSLAEIPTNLNLHTAVEKGTHTKLLGDLVSVLDPFGALPGVQLTTLVKVLHRKRPLLIPLFDDNVRRCYWTREPTAGYPMTRVRNRRDAEFFPLLAGFIDADLERQREDWTVLASHAPADTTLLRVFDVVAWRLGRGDAGS